MPWDFETFPQYLDAVERRGTVLNYGCYVGHTAVRLYVMGEDGLRARGHRRRDRRDAAGRRRGDGGRRDRASPRSASPTHNGDGGRPVPSRVADLDELRGAARAAAASSAAASSRCCPAAVHATARCSICQRRDRPAVHVDRAAHDQGLPVPRRRDRPSTTRRAPRASRCGRRCRAGRSSFQMNLAEPFTFNMRPAFADADGPTRRGAHRAYRDPAWRQRRGRSSTAAACCRRTGSAVGRRVHDAPRAVGRSVVDIAERARRAHRST